MNLRIILVISFASIYGFGSAVSFANDTRISLVPVVENSYCTFTEYDAKYELGVVGTDWALTFEVPEEGFSGKVQANRPYFYRGPDIRRYIRKRGGPARPPVPKTKEYTQIELAGINVDIERVKTFDKTMFPIDILVNDFVANGQTFHIPRRVNIVCSGALP